jgi:hypothetical protein
MALKAKSSSETTGKRISIPTAKAKKKSDEKESSPAEDLEVKIEYDTSRLSTVIQF